MGIRSSPMILSMEASRANCTAFISKMLICSSFSLRNYVPTALLLMGIRSSPMILSMEASRANCTAFISKMLICSSFSLRNYVPTAVKSCSCAPKPICDALTYRWWKRGSTWSETTQLRPPSCSHHLRQKRHSSVDWHSRLICWEDQKIFIYHSRGCILALVMGINHLREPVWQRICRHISTGGDRRQKNLSTTSQNLIIWECQTDPFSGGIYQHSKILSLVGQFKFWFLPTNDNPQDLINIYEVGACNVPVEGPTILWLNNYCPDSKALGYLSFEPIYQRENSGRDLGCCGKRKTKFLELEDFPVQGVLKVILRSG